MNHKLTPEELTKLRHLNTAYIIHDQSAVAVQKEFESYLRGILGRLGIKEEPGVVTPISADLDAGEIIVGISRANSIFNVKGKGNGLS